MISSTYFYELKNFNGYEAYFLAVATYGFLGKPKKRFVPAMVHYINGTKNTCKSVRKLPKKINSKNFFCLIHAQNKSQLDEFVREHPDLQMYLEKLKEYLKSNK